MEEIQIKFNTKKIYLRIAIMLAILPVAIWFAVGDTSFFNQFQRFSDPTFRKFLGWILIISILISIFFFARCLFSKKGALFIDKIGIEDNSQLFSKNMIYWNEIYNMERTNIRIYFMNTTAIKINFKESFQNPVYLSSSIININDEELFKDLQLYFEKFIASNN